MPPGIKFSCPHCSRLCKVPPALAGKQGRCPGCRKGLEVPRSSTVAGPGEGAAARESEAKRPSERAPQVLEPAPGSEAAPASCPACGAAGPVDGEDCLACGAPLLQPRAPRATLVALALFLCAPLVGLPCALLGLREARRARHHVALAWWAVGLNGVNLVLFLAFEASRRLGS